ncbi:hypothetical protein NPIL_382931 [Nephila pilipes]|uniref:Uncharacterized protein n=1 Tax=Nephila pilipes TaxID=299642 RepID=A0A8X6QGK8_NEPPI|nr:hypothetical protein NPIL_382931 [Nephila pilipes]
MKQFERTRRLARILVRQAVDLAHVENMTLMVVEASNITNGISSVSLETHYHSLNMCYSVVWKMIGQIPNYPNKIQSIHKLFDGYTKVRETFGMQFLVLVIVVMKQSVDGYDQLSLK